MSNIIPQIQAQSREKFQRSTFRAQLADLLARISGESRDLVKFDEVAKRLRARQQIERGIQTVSLKQIVGSVGRYRDFTRRFLPRSGVNQERWTRIDAVMNSLEGLPPVDLYKIGEVYFVKDGNHRISVARANGVTSIEAYVTELPIPTSMPEPLTLDDFARDQWILKAEYADFLNRSGLDKIRPEHQIRVTKPGRYENLLRHIEVHRYLYNISVEQQGREDFMTWEEAVASWYDKVYMPVVAAIHQFDLLRDFPRRTETDLYVWITQHREKLSLRYELAPLSPEAAVNTFARTHSERPLVHALQVIRHRFRKILGLNETPQGMSRSEFYQSRQRHDTGEISISEAELIDTRTEPYESK
ncbi:hypothetical protein KFU94_52955 [Chloroflexi bacterium TSY]|nr:hypothetical protein [Chloroflexi bacterium TSY]